jgi:hypothetical protein
MKRPNGCSKSRQTRREEAVERQEERDKLTPEQQIEVLDRRLGKDDGAIKERVRLMKQAVVNNQKTRTKSKKNSKNKKRKPEYEYY